ncbi:MAG: DNA primase small subunit PriS [Methanophagales archaeon]|nr:DNA primase small subunit PriS [Methanophagales archaeon]
MKEETRLFVKRKFKEYYTRARIELPKDFWMREWGFVLFDQYFPAKLVMRRHKSFTTKDDLMHYLGENAPAHAYYSSALYQYPAADMAKKGWIGSDLIFDLDADHIISEAEFKRSSYEQVLERVKEETVKLIDFLINDFGFGEDDIELVFSGSRGYHIHIKTDEVRGLGSRERREIVDYVGRGPDVDVFLVYKAIDYGGEELRRCQYCNKITKMKICPICHGNTTSLSGQGDLRLLTHGAWGKRLLKGLIDFLHEIAEMEEEKAITALKKIGGVGEQRARDLIRVVKDEMSMKRIAEGKLGQISGFPQSAWQEIIKSVRVRIDTDAPVTADIKRLIRLPTSLHGKSSLEVKPLRIETFNEFDPVVDAVVFGDSPVEIRVVRDSSITLNGERYKVEEGEIASVPEHAALYFICRGVAEIK